MPKKLIVTAVVVVLFILLGVTALNTPFVATTLARRYVHQKYPQVRIAIFKVKSQNFSWPGKFVWENLHISGTVNGDLFVVRAAGAEVSGLQSVFKERKSLALAALDADASFRDLRVSGLRMRADLSAEPGRVSYAGPVAIRELFANGLEATVVRCNLQGSDQSLGIENMRMLAYDGTIFGEVNLILPGPEYTADLRLENIEISRLEKLNERLASDIKGRVKGNVKIKGFANRIESLSMDWSMPRGGQINPSLLSALSSYMPQSQEKKKLASLITRGARLPVEVLSVKAATITPQDIAGEIHVKSRTVNLELNLTNEIHSDGKWTSLWDYWKTLRK